MNWKNELARRLNIEFPFIQAPMLGITTPEMVAAVSNTGALGSLPLGLANKEKAEALLASVKKQTSNTFQVNFFVYDKPIMKEVPDLEMVRTYFDRYGLPFPDKLTTEDPYTHYEDLIDIILRAKVPVVSFTFGLPGKDIIKTLQSNGVVLIGSASCVQEAKMVEDAGIDIVVAQGIEAGGHRSTFIEGDLPQVGLISLLPQVLDAIKIPVIAAGGLIQGRSIGAAFALGAHGVQLGSAFLLTPESMASDSYKNAVAASVDTSTVLTNSWSGRYARGIQNGFISDMRSTEVMPYPLHGFLVEKLRQLGKQEDRSDIQALWAGQSCRYAKNKNAAEVMNDLIKETEKCLSDLNRLFEG